MFPGEPLFQLPPSLVAHTPPAYASRVCASNTSASMGKLVGRRGMPFPLNLRSQREGLLHHVSGGSEQMLVAVSRERNCKGRT